LVSDPPSFNNTTGIVPLEVACIPIERKTHNSPFIRCRSKIHELDCLKSVFLNWENQIAEHG